MSAGEPFTIPYRYDGVCPSPFCATPHTPVNFDRVRSCLIQFYHLIYSIFDRFAYEYAQKLFRTEFCLTGVLERRVLERWDSTKSLEGKLDRQEDDVEIARLLDGLFEDGEGGVANAILVELGIFQEKTILQTFATIQEIFEASCDPAGLKKQPTFCFHGIAGYANAFEPAITKLVHANAQKIAGFTNSTVDRTRLDREITGAFLSGRWRGEEDLHTVLGGVSSAYLASSIKVGSLISRRMIQLVDRRFLPSLEDPMTAFSLVYQFLQSSSDESIFLCSANYRSFLRNFPVTRSPPSSASTSASPQHTPIRPPPPSTPFSGICYPHAFAQSSLLSPSTVCSPDRCSGRTPIAANFEVVDSMLMEILGWRFMGKGIKEFHGDQLLMMAAVTVAVEVGTLGVGQEKDRQQLIASIPEVLEEHSQSGIIQRETDFGMLTRAIRQMKDTLFTINRFRQPCLCDLTHLTEELAAEVSTAKAYFEVENSRLATRGISEEALKFMAEGFLGNGKSRQDQSPFSERGWVNQVDDYLRFMHQPISRAMSSSRIILRCHDAYLCLILQLGGVGVLEEIWAFALGDYRTEPKPEEAIPMLQSLVDDTHDFLHDGEVRNNALAAIKAHKDGDLKSCLQFYVKVSTLDPTDYLARINSSGIRLRLANDSDQKFQWSRAIYDATMAMYYGPPNFKAYYRRGLALAHLKMWKKAIADFERALEIEPGNVVAIQQLKLARMRRS